VKRAKFHLDVKNVLIFFYSRHAFYVFFCFYNILLKNGKIAYTIVHIIKQQIKMPLFLFYATELMLSLKIKEGLFA